MAKIVNGMTLAGLTILFSSFLGWLFLAFAPYHADLREFGRGPFFAGASLLILWLAGATGLALGRWRVTDVSFRIVFALNAVVAGLLISHAG
jgi:hypothetical protein